MDSSNSSDESHSTVNSRLLPAKFDPPRLRHGLLRVLEPHGRNRRPKAGDFKLLAAYVAAYTGPLIPPEVYKLFVDTQGEREWKRVVRAACDLEWRAGDARDFDEIPTAGYNNMRDHVAQAWPFAAKYFDGAWLIKWALRSTWTNRKKTTARVEKALNKERRNEDGLGQLSEYNTPTASMQRRRVRASRLGESLYCAGGCQRMLLLKHFPDDHVGICASCANYHASISPPEPQLVADSDYSGVNTTPRRGFLPDRRRQRQPNYIAYSTNGDTTRTHSNGSQRRRHSALLGSVTTYSDIGEYPSERSTYGVARPSQRRSRKGHGPRIGQALHTVIQRPREKAISQQLNEVEGLWKYLTNHEVQSLQRRRAANSQDGHAAREVTPQETTHSSSQDEEPTLQDTLPQCLTPNIRECVESICHTWDVTNVTDIFPIDLWPKQGTLWNLGVLEQILTIARQYPASHCREGITTKFAELVRARRQKSNAKTQWTIQDAKTTCLWAKEQYTSPVRSTLEPELYDNGATTLRSSQRHRKPSMKASLLYKDKGKQKAITDTFPVQPNRRSRRVNLSSSELSELDSEPFSDSNDFL